MRQLRIVPTCERPIAWNKVELVEQQTKPTMHDVARLAKVSANTVSRVVNGKPGVSEDTRLRIKRIIQDLGYHPHLGARVLRGAQEGCVGVTFPAPFGAVPMSQGFFIWIFTQLYRVFGARGERLCFDMNPAMDGNGTDYARGLWEHLFRVCIVAGPLKYDDTTIHRIHRSGAPYLAFGRLDSLPECSCATVDYDEGAYLSARYLIGRGHKRVAMLKAFKGFQPAVERRRGYLRALEEAGIAPDERLVRSVSFGARDIVSAVHRLLVDKTVTALVDCSATEDARSIREGARRAGRVPGKDLEIVCWTYEENVAVMHEACAHVWLPVREAAAEGFEQLAYWHNDLKEGPVRVIYPPVINEHVEGGEVPPPKRLFELLD